MSSRRDFLRNSGLVIMGGGAYLTTEQWLRGADVEDEFRKRLQNANSGGSTPAAGSSGSSEPEVVTKDKRLQVPTIVTIFLRGGADGLNALVPYGDDFYYKVRPKIAIPAETKGDKKGVIKLAKSMGNNLWGLNPSMDAFARLIEQGACVPFVNVGSPHGTRSHFSAQDYMERGAPGDARVTTGWLNRYLQASRKQTDAPLRGLCAMNLLPRSLRGEYPVLAGNNKTENMQLFEDLYAPNNLINQTARDQVNMEKGSRLDDRPTDDKRQRQLTSEWARELISDSGTNAVLRIRALERAMATQTGADYPRGGLANQLRTIAQVIKADVGLEVAQADVGGWDSHSGQGSSDGSHARRLKEVADAVEAFYKDLGPRMDKVLVLVMSEFGRTVHENGAEGTDHGRGGLMWAISKSIKGGKVFGTYKGVKDMVGDYQPVYTDFRAVFAEALYKVFNFDPFKPNVNLFPGYNPNQKDYLDYLNPVKKA